MKQLTVVLLMVVLSAAWAADLNLDGASNQTIENKTYGKAVINACSNITIRNCNFSSDNGTVVALTGACRNITIDGCDINGLEFACKGITLSWSGKNEDVTVKNCHIHNIADDGIEMHYGKNIKFQNNEIHGLWGRGTDARLEGPCNNGHSDAFEMANTTTLEVSGNLIYNVYSTSGFFIGNVTSKCYDFTVFNNIFHTPATGFNMYIHYVDGIKLYNNTVWNGTTGGISIGPDIQNLVGRNNIISAINFNHQSITPNSNHDFDWNLVGLANQGYPPQDNDVWSLNPLFEVIGHVMDHTNREDDIETNYFALQAGSPAINMGTTGADVPSTDMLGNPRVDAPDMGALEYQGTGITLGDLSAAMRARRNGFRVLTNPFGNELKTACDRHVQTLGLYAQDGTLVKEIRDGLTMQTKDVEPGMYLLKAERDVDGVVWTTVLKK